MNSKVYLGVFSAVAVIVAIMIICFLWNDNEVSYSRRGHYHVRSLEPIFVSSKFVKLGSLATEYVAVIEADLRKGADLDTTSVTSVVIVGGPTTSDTLIIPGDEYQFVSGKLLIVRFSAASLPATMVQTYNTTTNVVTLTFT